MVLELILVNSDDGFSAEVPSVRGCECWAHEEEEAIVKSIELVSFYLSFDREKIKVDKARREGKRTIYKLIIEN